MSGETKTSRLYRAARFRLLDERSLPTQTKTSVLNIIVPAFSKRPVVDWFMIFPPLKWSSTMFKRMEEEHGRRRVHKKLMHWEEAKNHNDLLKKLVAVKKTTDVVLEGSPGVPLAAHIRNLKATINNIQNRPETRFDVGTEIDADARVHMSRCLVREAHVQSDVHWTKAEIVKNGLRRES